MGGYCASFIAVMALYSTSIVELRRLEATRFKFVHVGSNLQENGSQRRLLTYKRYALVVPRL